MQSNYSSKHLYAAIAVTMISLCYWTFFQINSYNTFHLTEDAAYPAYSMYYYIHYSGISNWFQYLVFSQHIAIDQWMVMPFFYLFQSPLTLMILKVIVLASTGLLLFFLSRDLLKNQFFALAICIAYFLNPGMNGIMISDYNVEVFIIPFYILTFYFYMKLNKKMFYLSLFLLLGTVESIVPVAITFALGLLVYEYLFNKADPLKKDRVKLALSMILFSLVALLLYNIVSYSLLNTYASSGPVTSPILQLISFPLVPITSSLQAWNVTSASHPSAIFIAFIFGFVFMGFGISGLFNLASAIIFAVPWFVGAFIVRNTYFIIPNGWRYSYVVGGSIVSAIIGCELALREDGHVQRFFKRIKSKVGLHALNFLIPGTAIVFASLFTISSLLFLSDFEIMNPPQTVYLFSVRSLEAANYQQVNSVMALVPANASLMVQQDLFPYLFQRQYIELFENSTYYFQPEYILGDLNTNITLGVDQVSSQNFLANFEANNPTNYSVLATNGSAVLLKLNTVASNSTAH
jgi:uncharacterized membrane protein